MSETETPVVEERFFEVVTTITRTQIVRVTSDQLNKGERWEDAAEDLAGMEEGVISFDEDRDIDSIIDVTSVQQAKRPPQDVRTEGK